MTSIHSNTQPTAWVGINIAKRHVDALVDRPGHRRRSFRLANQLDDYQRSAQHLSDLPEGPVIGFEATGNYHRTLAFFLAEKGFSLQLVSSVAATRTREALYNSWDKKDPKDAQVIIHIVALDDTRSVSALDD